MRRFLAAIGVVALAIVAVDLAAMAALKISDMRHARWLPPLSQLAVYRGVVWAPAYWREWKEAVRLPERLRYSGDGILHLQPYRGRAINIDDAGMRRTTSSDCSTGATRIAMFGGSMLWGHGSDDAHTIPSLLAAQLAAEGRRACVRNDAQWGSTAARSAVELARELRRGARPDVVIVFVGSYDVKETVFGNQMDLWMTTERPEHGVALQRLWQRTHPPKQHERDLSTAEVRERTMAALRTTKAMVSGLASEYRFRALFVLHPYILASNKAMTAEEKQTRAAFDRDLPRVARAIRETYAALRNEPGVTDLSAALDGTSSQMFLDAGHYTPGANAVLAARLRALVDAPVASR